MIKNLTALEIKSSERIYRLLCEVDSPLGEVYDVLCQMQAFVVTKINETHKVACPEKEVEEIKES